MSEFAGIECRTYIQQYKLDDEYPAQPSENSYKLSFIHGPGAGYYSLVYYNLPFLISSTTPGSSKVLISPRFSVSPSAILRRMRRMIFPLLVLGRPFTNWILSGLAIGPITRETVERISFRVSSSS